MAIFIHILNPSPAVHKHIELHGKKKKHSTRNIKNLKCFRKEKKKKKISGPSLPLAVYKQNPVLICCELDINIQITT